MLSLYELLKAQKTDRARNMFTLLAGRNIGAKGPFDPTGDADYIFTADTIMYYIGESKRPEIPSTLGGTAIKKLSATAFACSDITAVKIPEGMEEIG